MRGNPGELEAAKNPSFSSSGSARVFRVRRFPSLKDSCRNLGPPTSDTHGEALKLREFRSELVASPGIQSGLQLSDIWADDKTKSQTGGKQMSKESHSELSLLIAFADFTRFMAQCQRLSDPVIAYTIDAVYELVGNIVKPAGGRVVKFIGDAALIIFPEDAIDRGVRALLDLKKAADDFMVAQGWECRLSVKAHFGTAIGGPFGVKGDKRYDVIGKAVNTAATLEAGGVTLSVEAFRKLGSDTRKHFKKHTSSVTYIRTDDPHRYKRWMAGWTG
jgi:class 3 adenylate cyclase